MRPSMRSGTFMVDWLTREELRTEPGKQKDADRRPRG